MHRADRVPFSRVLIANRGEIAVRIGRTLRRLGVESVAVYSEADAGALHVRVADLAVPIGPAPATESYLRVERIIEAALATGAEAIHPGYGFLSERPELARAAQAAGVVFIGPPPEAIEQMGDKITARRMVSTAGVPVVPGVSEPGLDDADLADAAVDIGFPVLIKPSAGGGGKGMRLVRAADELRDALASARREAAAAFGDDTLFIERFVERPRHIEVQVLADAHGGALHLGERECSLQRRHQKIIEEAPSALITPERREVFGALAVDAARACGYRNAGTVELIVSADDPDAPYFMEMNTRLQVEHPVTEAVWGIDLVEAQLRIAAGEPLWFGQQDLAPRGHAIEARIYAEDPAQGFMPAPGRLLSVDFPSDAVRVDTGVESGDLVSTHYDPMIAKVIATGADREAALDALDQALDASWISGITTNIGFLRRLLARPEVRDATMDTGLVEANLGELQAEHPPADLAVLAALASEELDQLGVDPDDPWAQPGGWRLAGPNWSPWWGVIDGEEVEVRTRGVGAAREARIGAADPVPVRAELSSEGGDDPAQLRWLRTRIGMRADAVRVQRDGDTVWLGRGGSMWRIERRPLAAGEHRSVAESSGVIHSPMPGVVVGVLVAAGDQVAEGAPVVVVEAMKMEYTLRAPFAAEVTAVHVAVGDRVGRGESLAELTDVRDPRGPADAPMAPQDPQTGVL